MTGTANRFGPNPETQAVYEQPYHEVYQGPFPTLQPLLHRLADTRGGAGHAAPAPTEERDKRRRRIRALREQRRQ